ncbi:hypothetical protein EMIT013CA1_30213 [Bacillus sp. IT-13CA1]
MFRRNSKDKVLFPYHLSPTINILLPFLSVIQEAWIPINRFDKDGTEKGGVQRDIVKI